jgi:hypothetical protein
MLPPPESAHLHQFPLLCQSAYIDIVSVYVFYLLINRYDILIHVTITINIIFLTKKTFYLTHSAIQRVHVKNEPDNDYDFVSFVLCKQAADSKTMSVQSFAGWQSFALSLHCKSALYVHTFRAYCK